MEAVVKTAARCLRKYVENKTAYGKFEALQRLLDRRKGYVPG